jgi:RNA-directed DNA polymerase
METGNSTEHLTTRKHEEQNVALTKSSGRNPRWYGQGASMAAAAKTDKDHQTDNLIEVVVERQNMFKALRQVKRNKGAAE